MIEAVECIGYLIDIRTDLMGCFFFKSVLSTIACKAGKLKHQVLLTGINCRKDLTCT